MDGGIDYGDCGIQIVLIITQVQGVEGVDSKDGASITSSIRYHGASDIIPSR